jgi:DNA repair protein RecN (Recombination protein N)
MLKSLSIRNVVLIDKLDLDFTDGFSVLSGETGAGKSILLDSVGLLLGRRADIGMIRNGADKLAVSGIFEIEDKSGNLAKLCAEYDLDFAKEIIIKRTLATDGKGKIFFNDQPVTQKLLKEIGTHLVEVHGQFDNQGLLNPATHRDVLDGFGAYEAEMAEMKNAFAAYKQIKQNCDQAEEEMVAAQKEEENLRHWNDEFMKVKPQDGEVAELEQKRRELMNSEKIAENLNTAYKAINQTANVVGALRQAQSAIARVNAVLNDKFGGIYEILDTALVNVEEVNEEIETALNDISLNQNDLDALEERLFTLKSLARKHGVTVDELTAVQTEIADKLAHLERGEDELTELQKAKDKAWKKYSEQAEVVSKLRQKAAEILDEKIKAELPDLKMEKAGFKTKITQRPVEAWNETGCDDVCFTVSTNPNTPYDAISKIASGGELSRFMLALKVNLAQVSDAETMIFDEVDSGIGGATAKAVGDKLAKLGNSVQVLVVTHSPQVAAQSKCHFKVEKTTENNVTTTHLHRLNAEEKIEEVARMLSGEYITDEARAAAKVLIGV